MIPSITEVNFPSYATLHQATVSLQEMGERTITTQVRIDGSVTPSFEGWELRFKGERFVLPTRTPQAAKDNTTKNALVDLTFQSWAIEQLKHYFFVSLSEYETGKFIPDQYNASVILPLESFVQLFNRVLQYYFGTGIRMDLFGVGTGIYSNQPVSVEINKTYIWDVLIKFYELFDVRWYIEYEQATGAYVIKVGYAADAITDHDFEYGYMGGLLKFERNVQDADIRNILLGRGGEKNLPYRYFKLRDPQNQEWAADPDAIPELANIYFDRLRDINFRWYVRGWMQNPNRDTSWDATHTFPQYTESQCPTEYLFAFRLGKTDAKFNPVEYVKDDASITKYGERWGAVEDNDEVFPTIQGMTGTGLGRVDECVDVSDIVTDDIEAAVTEAATVRPIAGEITITKDFSANEQKTDVLRSEQFTIPSGSTGNLSAPWLNPIAQDGAGVALVSVNTALSSVKAVRVDNGTEYDIDTPGGFPAGTYYAKITVVVKNYNTSSGYSNVTYGLQSLDLTVSTPNTEAWKPTFDIWVKNIWETTQDQGETDEQYAARVWEPILGDRVGNEAKLVFSDGFMSVSQDYEFTIASYPVKDRSKSINGVQSEWKMTLFKSDAEFKATGLYVPNATTGGKPAAGDHFFFIGIDMPFLYVTKAEELLNGATMTPAANKTAALSDLADVQPTWVISLDKVRVHTLEDGEYGQTLAERLSAGATVRIKDSRFTGGQALTLYVKSITYTWNEPATGNPYLVPDIEVVLSDTVISAEGAVTRVANELNVVKTTYAKSADIESTVRAVGNALFLKKTGESDRSSSPTQFASKVTSASFRQGDIGGKGWGFYDEEPAKVQAATRAAAGAEEKGNSVLEIDKLVVRKDMRVNSLVANQISYVGGRQITSAAAIECTQVVESAEGYYCYFNQKQGTVANLFVVGDFAMGQMFDPTNIEMRYYKARVDEIGSNYILLSNTVKDGDGVPAVGDTIVQHGHESNTARQFVIIRDVIGGGYERMLSGLDAVDAEGDEYYFAGRLASQSPRWFVGDAAGEYAEWANGRLNIKGTIVVRNSDGTYQAMTDYMAGVSDAMRELQAQIDGQIQSWSSGEAETPQTEPFPQVVDDVVDPSTANFPASGWTLSSDREKHFGDIYVDDSTGQGYRYTKRVKNGVTEYYWTRITDEEVAEAMRLAQLANQGVAGLQYLKAATNNGATLVDGGLILSNLMALGQTINQQFQVTAGINGIMNAGRTRLGGGLAAWFGGDMSDKDDLDQGVTAYAKSVFRFDGSGYLAGGNIHWDQSGYGGIPGITWNGNDIIIGGNVKLASLTGDSVTELLSLVQALSRMFVDISYQSGGNTRHYIKVNPDYFDGIAAEGFGVFASSSAFVPGGGGGTDLANVWISLKTNTDQFANEKVHTGHLPLGAGLTVNQQTGLVDVTVQGVTRARDLEDADDLSYVDPESGEEITIDDPGTTGTVLWGAESANQVSLDVNGVSKTLVKIQALDGIRSSITTILGYFSGSSAYNALALEGHNSSYFATATGLNNLSATVAGLVTGVSSVAGKTGAVSLVIGDVSGLTETLAGKQAAGNYVNTIGGAYGVITLGSGLTMSGNQLSVTGQTQGTVTRVDVGSTQYEPSAAGVVSLPAYPVVPTALSAFTNDTGYITMAVNDLVNYYLKSETYTQTEVNSLIAAINQFHYEVYASTSSVTDPQPNVLYLIGPTGSGSDKYEEYVYPNATAGWVKIGDTTIDLSPYLTITSAQSTYQPIISDLSTIRSRADEGHTVYGYFSNGVLGLAHIPLDDRLSYVDPEDGEEITIDDPGTTGTVLWGAESANQVSLDVNGVSKTLVKIQALDGIRSSITTILGYFSGSSAYNALALEGHNSSYFATATGLNNLSATVAGLVTGVSSVAGKTGAVSLVIGDVSGLTETLAGKQAAGNYVNTIGGAYGVITLGSGLTMSGNQLSVTGQTIGTVTSVGLSMPTGFSVGSSPITSSGTIAVTFASGYSLPSNATQETWNAKYDKPSTGIPKTDLASAVQTSLGKADSAIQSHQTVTLASGTDNGTLKITTAAGTVDNIAVTGLGAAAYRGVATTIGSSITNLVSGSLLYNVLGSAFDSSNTVVDFVNSSVATATATFRGTNDTATTESAFLTWANGLTKTLNDYVFWKTTDSAGNVVFKRYKYGYDGTEAGSLAWRYEYDLNNSSFTAAQWSAINSGITSTLVTAFNAKYDKPPGGIPKTDLASAVRTSLGKADTALQSHQTIYGLTIKNSAGTDVLSYNPASAAGALTLAKAMVGLGNVENFVYNVPTGAEQTYTYPV